MADKSAFTNGSPKFKVILKIVLEKIRDLKDHHAISKSSIQRLKTNSATMMEILETQKQRIVLQERRKKSWLLTGLTFKVFGAIIALIYLCILDAPVPTLVTSFSVIGLVIKLEAWYSRRRTSKSVMARVNEYFASRDFQALQRAEKALEKRIASIIGILKELYGDPNSNQEEDTTEDGSNETNTLAGASAGKLRTPRLISAMKAAKKVASLNEKFSSVLEYSSDLGVESMEVVEQTYDVASASLGEIMPAGLVQGAIGCITIIVSLYEVYRLLASKTIENETTKKIQEHIMKQENKIRIYRETLTAVELFTRCRC